ncbi:MAG: ribulose-phosphate 3-epimerase [Saprospiraceae bacterium]|nr:ribulose-phosphate 3-epimerase [Saprospiraceae bacterium]
MKHLVAPSVLAADFSNLSKAMDMVNGSEADWLHVDIMDGHFVPNLTFGMMIVKVLKKLCGKPLDVHLMIEKPEQYIEAYREAGADVITVHYEACPHIHRTLQQIKATGAKAGVALNPGTPVSAVKNLIEDADLFCLMSVNPGFGGQKFIYETLAKVRELHSQIIERNSKAIIEIDGGVGLQNAETLLQAGARVLVAGSAVFKAEDPLDVISRLKSIGKDTLIA